jgi:membrane glycosyltransferase
MSPRVKNSARLSLAFLWLFTALASAFFALDIGYDVLAQGGITGNLASACIYAGSLVDAIIGLWLLTNRQLRLCYLLQMLVIVVYSLLLTWIALDFWLHPFGPLTKNVPLLALIYILFSEEKI